MEKKWVLKPYDKAAAANLQDSLNINPKLCQILAQRGIHTYDEAHYYFRPKLEHLHDPFLMKGMAKAVGRIMNAMDNGERIMIYGDYDVDGTTSVALVYSVMSQYYSELEYYVPDRYSEGYGISKKGIDTASENNVSLIIALDCGIRAVEQVQYATENDIDFIICDHHLPGKTLPNAIAILDPKQSDCQYPFKELSGCGIGYKLMQALIDKSDWDIMVLEYQLDLAAVSIASDIVPIIGENRVLAYYGLQKLNEEPRPSFKALLESAGYKGQVSISDVVFKIGPRINASGRIKHAKASVETLINENYVEALDLASQLSKHNETRKTLDVNITKEALEFISESEEYADRKSTVVFNPDWHKGVVGIVASRILEHHYRPTIVLTESNGKVTGSARSVKDFDIHQAIASCSQYLENFGGHKYAAGLTLAHEQLDSFILAFEQAVSDRISDEMLTPLLEIDSEINFEEITPTFHKILKQLAPFGPENMQPVFLARNVSDTGFGRILKDAHLKCRFQQTPNGASYDAIGFGLADKYTLVEKQQKIDLCFTLEENTWQGVTNLQLNIKDIKPAGA